MARPHFNFTVQEVINQNRVTREKIEELKLWLQTEDFPELVEEQIVLFLLSCDCIVSATQATIKAHYKSKLNVPEFFNNRNVDLADLQQQLNIVA